MNPAEEQQRLHVVKEALSLLADGEPITLADATPNASGPYREIVRKVFKKLAEHHVVERIAPEANGMPAKWLLLHADALDALRKNDEDISSIIWPGSAAPSTPPETEMVETDPQPEQTTEAQPTLEQKVDSMMGALITALQVLTSIKEKVEGMEAKVNRLHAELTGEKG